MPRDPETYNEVMNIYMKNRWMNRRKGAIDFLGGKCVVCGSADALEFDHIDPSTKILTIARASSRSEDFFWQEVKKCQLLCKDHHIDKTRSEQAVEHGGGVSGKKNCKCELCRIKKNEYLRSYRARKKASLV